MAYTVDPFDDTRPVGADDAGELTNELRQIKTQLKRFRDGVEKDFNELYETMSEADGGLPLELGGTGVQSLNGLKELLGISGEDAPVGIGGMAAFNVGTHLWQVPTALQGTGRKFIVVLSGGGGGGYSDSNRNGYSAMGGAGGLSVSILTTTETSIQVVVGAAGTGGRNVRGITEARNGKNSTFGVLMTSYGGKGATLSQIGTDGTASGGLLNLTGGGSRGGRGAKDTSASAGKGVDGYCVIFW